MNLNSFMLVVYFLNLCCEDTSELENDFSRSHIPQQYEKNSIHSNA
jgi:hypothetical protein